jgi:hypothetical protein
MVTLSLIDFRERTLTCDACFVAPSRCWHHEDVVGGYGTGKIVFVGINPQASPSDTVYQTIRSAPWSTKLRLSDLVLKIFAGEAEFADVDDGWSWMANSHQGLKTWLPLVCTLLAVTPRELANQFRFVEAYKHATADQGALHARLEWKKISATCPNKWLVPQLELLEPSLIVLSGAPGKNAIAPLLLSPSESEKVARQRVADLHGSSTRACIGGRMVPILFTLAISNQTKGRWLKSARTEDVRRAMRDALRGHRSDVRRER